MLDKQSQAAGAGTTALQAGRDVVVVHQEGITYEAARQIALDVYQANFPQLAAQAKEVATARAEELTDKFLKQLHKENPNGLQQAASPDFQYALLNAQRDHARAGDENLADLLVDLLVDRTKHKNRELLQLVLDEALHTAPKLTDAQLAVLAVIFLLRYVNSNSGDVASLTMFLKKHVEPVLHQAEVTQSTFAHLEFTGCGSQTPFTQGDLKSVFCETYAALFQKGFSDEELAQQNLPEVAKEYVIPLPSDHTRKQISILNNEVLTAIAKKRGFDEATTNKLNQLLVAYRLSPDEIKQRLVQGAPFLSRAFDLWEKEAMGRFTLTSVGMALGHAFVKKTIGGEFAPLSIWIK